MEVKKKGTYRYNCDKYSRLHTLVCVKLHGKHFSTMG